MRQKKVKTNMFHENVLLYLLIEQFCIFFLSDIFNLTRFVLHDTKTYSAQKNNQMCNSLKFEISSITRVHR